MKTFKEYLNEQSIKQSDYKQLIDYAKKHFAKTVLKNKSEEYQNQWIEQLIDMNRKKIESKNFEDIWGMLSSNDNKVSHKLFQIMTGIRLGNSQKSRKDSLIKYVGQDNYEEYLNNTKIKKDKDDLQYKQELENEELNQKINYNGKIMTWKEFYNLKTSEGFNKLERKGTRYILHNKRERLERKVPNKIHAEYIKDLIDKLPKEKQYGYTGPNLSKIDKLKDEISKLEDQIYNAIKNRDIDLQISLNTEIKKLQQELERLKK